MNDLVMNDVETLDDLKQPVPGGVLVLHNNIIRALRKAYPKWRDTWHIRIDTRGGIVQVYNTAFTGEMGFVIHIEKIDPKMKKIVSLAGELFERYHISRGRGLNIENALSDLERDAIGRAKYED